METVEHLRELFRYNDWANRRIVASLDENDCERARKILAHLLTTEQEYLERLPGKDSTGFDFWPDLSIDECEALRKSTADTYEKLLGEFTEDDLDSIAAYKTSEGIGHENTFRELLTHVVLHSSIHRGSIIIKLREFDFEPPKIDYIIYMRETR